MGSSAKKRMDKQKDFRKPKLKVGKTRPKASNYTDTSFKAKAIVLSQQSLHTTAPSSSSQFSHHLSLLTSRTDSQRRDSLSYLTAAIAGRPVNTPLQQPAGVILPKLLPLILDGNNGVRLQLTKLLQTLPTREVEGFIDQILLYARAAMTHLAVDIRNSSMDVLRWALRVAGSDLVSCVGGWVKTLNCFLALLSWPNEEQVASWSSAKVSFGKAGNESKALLKVLTTLASFLHAGLGDEAASEPQANTFPLWHVRQHMLPKRSTCFAHLNLFGHPRDEESEIYEDRESRQRIFHTRFQKAIERGLNGARQEGGEIGRAAASVQRVLLKGMGGYGLEDF